MISFNILKYFILAVFCPTVFVFSQNIEIKNEADRLGEQIIILRLHLDSINHINDSLSVLSASYNSYIEKCNDDLYSFIGITMEQLSEYRSRFLSFEQASRSQNYDISYLRNEFSYISESKARCLPEFSAKYLAMISHEPIASIYGKKVPTELLTLTSSNTYTVKPGDNLYEIAETIYNDRTKWSLIFEANKFQIKDPDLIYPGQLLNLPAK